MNAAVQPGNGGTLTVRSATGVENFTLTGTASTVFKTQSDGDGGTLVTAVLGTPIGTAAALS